MRLFLFPISSKHTLVYAQRLNQQLTTNKGYIERITAYASKKWSQWEASDGRIQKKVTAWGNNAFNRIPYQEWGLKSIPPLSARRKREELRGREKVDAVFPSSIIPSTTVPDILRNISIERQDLHRRSMWWSIVGIPFTFPIALIPIIPNLPFFYLVFRAWSHWRALAGSKHVQFLLENHLVNQIESPILTQIYNAKIFSKEKLDRLQKSAGTAKTSHERERQVANALASTESGKHSINRHDDGSGYHHLLTKKHTGKLVSVCFDIPQVAVEIERASSQVSKLIENEEAQQALSKEKEEKAQEGLNKLDR